MFFLWFPGTKKTKEELVNKAVRSNEGRVLLRSIEQAVKLGRNPLPVWALWQRWFSALYIINELAPSWYMSLRVVAISTIPLKVLLRKVVRFLINPLRRCLRKKQSLKRKSNHDNSSTKRGNSPWQDTFYSWWLFGVPTICTARV